MRLINYYLIVFAWTFSFSAQASIRDLAAGARDTFKIYVKAQRLISCQWFHNPEIKFYDPEPFDLLAKVAVYPGLFLVAPQLLDLRIQNAVSEVEHNAMSGDLDINHSATYTHIISLDRLNGSLACERPLRAFARQLHQYLMLHARLAAKEADADLREGVTFKN